MYDLHCHILPGVDDGSKSIEESIKMAKLAVSEGITHILVTPHHQKQDWINEKETVVQRVNNLQAELDDRNIDLTLFPGQEVSLYGDLLDDIEKDKILYTDEGNTYILVEFPTGVIPHYAERLFYELQSKGKTPIIVHPERNHAIIEHPNRLKNLIDKGALAQLTAASYTGKFGKKIEKLSKQLIEANLVHFIASDAHNSTNRKFHMKKAYEKLSKEYGRSKRNEFHQTTKDLLNGEPIIVPDAQYIQRGTLSKLLKRK